MIRRVRSYLKRRDTPRDHNITFKALNIDNPVPGAWKEYNLYDVLVECTFRIEKIKLAIDENVWTDAETPEFTRMYERLSFWIVAIKTSSSFMAMDMYRVMQLYHPYSIVFKEICREFAVLSELVEKEKENEDE